MALSSVLALDVGTATVKAAEFSIGGNGALTLTQFAIEELNIDPNKEESRFPAVASAVGSLIRDNNIRTRDCIMSVSGPSVFLRIVPLPPVQGSEVKRIVRYEAASNVPFPIDEVVWDYQIMPGKTDSDDVEAIIVAIKGELLEGESKAAEMNGLRPKHIDVGPLALYNSFRYNYPIADECTLLIDMGARTSNLLFMERTNLWTRGIPIGGNMITQNICNDMQEPFMACETLKRGKGFVSLGGAYADPDDRDAARISKLIRSTMTRLHNEINRSITFYRTSQGGSAPKRIVLTGGSCQLPYADVFLGEKLQLSVEYFNSLQNVTLASGLDKQFLTDHSCYMGELVGLAARETGACPVEITLVPPSLQEKRENSRRRPALVGALLGALLFASIPALGNWQITNLLQDEINDLDNKIGNFESNQRKMEPLIKKYDQLEVQAAAAKKLLMQRDSWVEILSAIHNELPEGVWVTNLTPLYATAKENPDNDKNPYRVVGVTEPLPRQAGEERSAVKFAPEVNMIRLSGLFHSDSAKETMNLDGTVINSFLAKLLEAKSDDGEQFFVEEWSEKERTQTNAPPGTLAFEFSLVVRLKNPIPLTP